MAMTLGELPNTLTNLCEEWGEDTEVRLAVQPNWPFEHRIAGVEVMAVDEDGADFEDDRNGAAHLHDDDEDREPPVVYIFEGGQMGYLPGAVRDMWPNG